MSLIKVWRDRRAGNAGPARPPRLWKLVLTALLIGYLIWYLDRLV